MNKKLIAVAVSSALAAPVIAQAEGEVKVYGRINQAVQLVDNSDGDSNVDVTSIVSRFGIRYDNDLGNGLSVHGRYEFGITTDRELSGGEDPDGGNDRQLGDVRIATAGISGAFGRFDVGNQWSAYFNTFGTFVDPTYTLGFYLYSSVSAGPYRGSNTLKYSNTFGPVTFQLDGRLNGSDEKSDVAEKLSGDGIGAGIKFNVGDYVTIGLAADYEDGVDSSGVISAAEEAAEEALDEAERRFASTTGDVDDAALITVAQITDGTFDLDTAFPATSTDDGVLANRRRAERYAADATAVASANVAVENAADVARTDNTTRYGIAVQVKLGELPVSVTGGWQNLDIERVGVSATGTPASDLDVNSWWLWFTGDFNESTKWLLGYSYADGDASSNSVDPDADVDQFTWAVYHTIGGGMRVYYEAISLDRDVGRDVDHHIVGLRLDF